MAVEFELPVLQISMAAVDKMQGPDALRALWTVFTKTTGALADGTRLENMTWRLWHRQMLLDRPMAPDNAVAAPIYVAESPVEIVDDDDSGGEWEDDSAPPSRDPTIVPTASYTDKTGVNTRRQSSTVREAAARSPRLSSQPLAVLSVSQPTASSRPTFNIQSRSNSSPDNTSSHGTNIGRIISHLLPDKFEVAVPSSLATQSSIPASPTDLVLSTPRIQPVQFLIQSPSTPPNPSVDVPAHLPTLMVINPTPRPTPPATPSSRARAVPTNIPVALSPSTTPLALAAPSTLSQPHLVLLPCPSASDKLVPAAALPLTPTTVTAPELADEDSKKKIFYVQSPEGAIGSDDGRSHSSSSNSNTTSNVTDAHPTLGGQKTPSISSATTDEAASSVDPTSETTPPPTQDVAAPRGTNHPRHSSGNTAYTRTRAARGAKASKPAARAPYRGRPNPPVRTTSTSSDKSRGVDGKPRLARQHSVSEEVVEDIEETEGENKQTSASTSHTVTSLPHASPAPNLSMTPAKNQAQLPRTAVASRVVTSPAAPRQTPSHVRSPPNMVARASLVAPFTTIASAAPTVPTAHDAPAEAPRPPQNNNSSALLGLGRRALHVETSSDLDLESDSEESWSDDETDTEDPLARAANEASRQRSMFEKIQPKAPRHQTRTGLLTNLMNPDPRFFPQAAMRAHNSAQNLAAMRRPTAPAILQTSRSTVAVPKAAAVTAEEVTTHVSVDPTGRAVGGSGARGLRLQGRPQGGVDEEGSTDEENSMPNELSKTYAQRRLEALATKARVPPPPPMEQVRRSETNTPTPALAPRPAPQQPQAALPYDMDVRPIHSPRTVRRKMIAGELSESLRRNLMWERTSTRFAMGAGALGSGLRPLTGVRPGIQTANSDQVTGSGSRSGAEDEERTERRLALARNKSWANDFHHAGW
ncbi:hypothetical protein ACGC1H_002991 [Rhizoctonia solani]|uniref:Nitrogen regulatory protein areA GATA-like domain-containing protein n=1 Tax=Rhizoctonia solani TaxID=456999 RepID=A0A8H2X0Z6_9AGAM|nr:unnamed protein product [Rhizoctonia solani]